MGAGGFFDTYANDARIACAATGVLPSVILAQWAVETQYGASLAFLSGWNFAGLSAGGNLLSYPTEQEGVSAYISYLSAPTYNTVRTASGWVAQAQALGQSPWAASHYDEADWTAAGQPADGTWTPPSPGADLIAVVNSYNLTQYDSGTKNVAVGGPAASPVGNLGTPINPPSAGLASDLTAGSFILNGQPLTVDLSEALADGNVVLAATGASTLSLVLHDPDRTIINNPALAAASVLNVGGDLWSLVSVVKQASLVTATFEPWVVAALRQATGAFTVPPGMMTRTQFARVLAGQVRGASFVAPPPAALENLPALAAGGYNASSKEQLSRGTINQPLEDSWTCLQRLAAEIQWRCFAVGTTIYFAPDEWLALIPAAATVAEFTGGVSTVDAEWDIGQPLANATIEAVVDTWTPTPGEVVTLTNLGLMDGNWIVTQVERPNLFLPDITVTCSAPQPSLPEPSTGGAQAAVGAGFAQPGNQQTQAGVATAGQAVAFAESQLGVPYAEPPNPPNTWDCSSLVQAAYQTAGINLPRTSEQQWAAGPRVPDGAVNLRPGDLAFFGGPSDPAQHVGIVVAVDTVNQTATMINAPHTGANVEVDTFTPLVGSPWGPQTYSGATRPAQ